MPTYRYGALRRDGTPQTGLLTADTPQDARAKLLAMSLYARDVQEVRSGTGPGLLQGIRARAAARGRRQTVALLTRQLSTLLRTGIPLADSLGALIDQERDPLLQAVLRDVRERVVSGSTLADALRGHPALFGALYVNMVAAGEASGTLDAILRRLADFLTEQNRIRNRVATALTYPIFLVGFGILAIGFLMVYVMPQLRTNLETMGVDLPFLTRALIAASGATASFWWLPIVAAIAAWSGIAAAAARSRRFRLTLHAAALRIPAAGTLLKKQAIARFAQTLSTLLTSGIPAVEALDIVRGLVGNAVMEDTVASVRQRIVEGADIAGPMRASGIFPPIVAYMISVGEQTGELEQVLAQLSESMEEEIEMSIERFLSLLDPILIVLLAGVVGLVVMSILWPILELTTSFQSGM